MFFANTSLFLPKACDCQQQSKQKLFIQLEIILSLLQDLPRLTEKLAFKLNLFFNVWGQGRMRFLKKNPVFLKKFILLK